jgi:hypothetical protein
MDKIFFYHPSILPPNFSFPESYSQLVQGCKIPDLEPWKFLFFDMPQSLNYFGAMLQKYPDKPLVPFAIIDDQSGAFNDGYVVLACFDGDDISGDPKIYFHDYSNPKKIDWSDRYSVANFNEWLRVAEDDSSHYKTERAEGEIE